MDSGAAGAGFFSKLAFWRDETATETAGQYRILLSEAGNVVSKADLSERALGRKLSRYDRSLDMHVSNLRKKLGPLSDDQERIKTVRGVGYIYSRN